MPRHELTDEQWERIEHHFPEPPATGRPPSDPRRMLNAILWILRTGAPWRDVPESYGPWQTVYDHFNNWRKDGTLSSIVWDLQLELNSTGKLDHELWCIDGTVVRAARCAAGGGKKGTQTNQMITH